MKLCLVAFPTSGSSTRVTTRPGCKRQEHFETAAKNTKEKFVIMIVTGKNRIYRLLSSLCDL